MLSLKIFITQRRYFASAFLFTCFSLIFSTWITYIPYVAEKLGITEGKIGGAIFFASLGSFLMIPIANQLVSRFGVGRMTYISLVVYAISLVGPLAANNYISLCVILFVFGSLSSAYAIALNSLTATIEKEDKVYIMSGSHGFWSIGGAIGASGGSLMAAWIDNPVIHAVIVILIVISLQTWLRKYYYQRKGEIHERGKKRFRNMKPLIVIAIVGLIFMVAEGAIADWSALYLKKIVLTPLEYIGWGYAAFSVGMVIGRFTGDTLSKKLGSWQLLSYAAVVSIVGFILVLLVHTFIPVIGFFIVGLGFSVIVPEVYRLASRIDGVKTADGVSFIAATTNVGFLVGPVFLGFIAELRSLHFSFLVLTVFVSVSLIISIVKYRFSK
jgi:MFS family permease